MLKNGYLELALAMIFVGSSFVVAKDLTGNIPIFISNALRFTIAAVAMLPLLVLWRKDVMRIQRPDIIRLALLAFTGVFLFNVLLFIGLQYINASTSGIITSAAPVVTAVLAYIFLREAMSSNKIAAVFIVTLGILVINIFGNEASSGNSNYWLGFALICGVVLCEAAFVLLAKTVSNNVEPKIMTGIVILISCLLFLPFGIWEATQTNALVITPKDWLLIAYLGLIVNAGAYFLGYSGVKKATATKAAIFSGLIPITSIILAVIFLNEPLQIASVAGLALVLSGIGLVIRDDSRVTQREPTAAVE